jgi:hypothetical protein
MAHLSPNPHLPPTPLFARETNGREFSALCVQERSRRSAPTRYQSLAAYLGCFDRDVLHYNRFIPALAIPT